MTQAYAALHFDTPFTRSQLEHDITVTILQAHKDACQAMHELMPDHAPDARSRVFNDVNVAYSMQLKTSAGNAHTRIRDNYSLIKINWRLFTTTATLDDLRNTYIHELAHVFTNRLYRKQCHHDKRWKSLFKAIGGNGEMYHQMDVSNLRQRRKRYKMQCACTEDRNLLLTPHQYKKHVNFEALYQCKFCKKRLQGGELVNA